MSPVDDAGTELRSFLTVIRRRRWAIVTCAALVTLAAVVASLLQTRVYEGRARLLLELSRQSVFDNTGAQKQDAASAITEVQVIEGEEVRAAVAKRMGAVPPVHATPVDQTTVVELAVRSTSAKQAAAVTNAYGAAYIDLERAKSVNALLDAGKVIQLRIDDLQKRVDDVQKQLDAAPSCTDPARATPACVQRQSVESTLNPMRNSLLTEQGLYRQKLDQLQVDASLVGGGSRLLAPARVPTAPVSPKPLRNGLLGLVAGLIFGTAVAFVSDYVDDSIKTKEDVERAVPGLPVLGMIPTVPGWRNVSDTRLVSLAEPQSPAAEAYRITRTAIQFLALDRPLRVLQVTSPRASEGKTTTMANLAVALARAGQSVLLASCDLRRPRIHAFFGLPNDIGFTSVLLGETTLTAALQQVPGEPRLHLLASGPIPPDPAEFLSSPRASAVLTSLHEHADIVLVDSPPVLPVTDAAVLSGVVDGTLVVAMAGSTARPQLARTVEMLRQVNAPLLGVILNATAAEDVYAYRYEYRENAEPRRPGLRGRFGAPGNGSGPAPAPAPAGGATPGAGNGSGVPGPAPTGGGAVQEVGP